MMTYASLFTGGGLADWGARAAGLTPVWGVEYDPQIAAVAQANDDSGTVYAADVRAMNYAALPRVDVLHASPPCPNFSVAKTGRGETALDLELADAVARAIDAQRPALFTLENVRAYQDSQSLARIVAMLDSLDYHVTSVIVNAADYGVPQTRERLFIVAHAGGWMQAARPLPPRQPWRGWYQAIKDLIPTLPPSEFAPWQLARLRAAADKGMELDGDLFVGGANKSASFLEFAIANRPTIPGIRPASDPMMLVPADAATCMAGRAFVLDCQDSGAAGGLTKHDAAEPMYTLSASMEPKRPARAWLVGDGDTWRPVRSESAMAPTLSAHNGARAWLSQGRVVAMTPRALARFQSLPDAYALPERKALACRIIGNGVAVDAYAALLRSQR